MKIEIQDISDVITNVNVKMYVELLHELIDYAVLEEMIIENFNWLEEKEQEELLQKYSKKLNDKGTNK